MERTQFLPRTGYLQPGTQLSGIYEIDAPLAAGGMGEVYRGHSIQTGDAVAIKVIKAEFAQNEQALELFKKEARALHNLQHEAIVRYFVFAFDKEQQRHYLAMEFVEGLSLSDTLRGGPMAFDKALALARRIGLALDAAHRSGIIHRDVSPDNIILPRADVGAAKIIDFGIARSTQLGAGTIIGGGVAGKYSYMSPEQANGTEVGAKSDIYSFGLVLAEALRGKPIDMGGSLGDVIRKRQSVPDLSDIDARIRPLIEAMLQPDPQKRPESMQAVAEWRPQGEGRGGRAEKAAAKPQTPGEATARRRGGLYATLGALALLAGGGGLFVAARMIDWSRPPAPPLNGGQPPVLQPKGASEPPTLQPKAGGEPPALAPPAAPPPTADTPAAPPEPPATPDPARPAGDAPTAQGESPAAPGPLAAATPSAPTIPGEGPAFRPPDLGPLTEPARIEQMARFLREFNGGDCFVARPLAMTAQAAEIEGVATDADPLVRLNDAFAKQFGFEPTIGAWIIAPGQCAVAAFLSKARLDPALAPRLELAATNLRSGQYLSGMVEAPVERHIEVLQISDTGEA